MMLNVYVAPLAGSVDRNSLTHFFKPPRNLSLPSRGAWIEIRFLHRPGKAGCCRSPRGERG